MAAFRAKKVQSIAEVGDLGWGPYGSLRRAGSPPRVAPEVLLRSPLFLVPRQHHRALRQGPAVPGPFARMQGRRLPLTIGPETRTRLHSGLWRKQDKYYAAILVGVAVLVWWNPF